MLAEETQEADEMARVPLRQVLLSIAGLWFCYFVLITLRSSIVGLDFFGELLWRRALVCLAGAGITFVMWMLLRLFDHRRMWMQVVAALVLAVPTAILTAQANQMLFAPVQDQVQSRMAENRGFKIGRDEAGNIIIEAPVPDSPDTDGALGPDGATAQVVLPASSAKDEQWIGLVELALSRYFLLLAWAALYLALLAGARAQAAERRGERFRSAAKAAELRSLRYQVNPHFLFNTLNSLSSLVMTGKAERAEEMIQAMSNFYRHSLADDTTADVRLEDEFALQQHYLDIEMLRFPERLKVRFDLPPALASCRVPGMILQPLVENAVKYGVAPVNRPVSVVVSADEEFDRLVIRVTDDGPGVPKGTKPGFGIGLANVKDRIEARFGRDATITSGPVEDGYVSELRLPIERKAAA
ncbi:sensor histidine kinase [Erythrobacter sp. SDW2]|uniref:sensor histidine kinase n=1 Tax=Erythrobacter sp. SDW2 TaxID=2907154 RepID=UPI001F1E7C5E|nr:sensor histidine kinase [Erythrobacter sp. SDW2]UIP07287.1 sensor histidine kinase [Erythrobacter sp. SDW2]